MKKLSIVVPVYFNSESLFELFEQLVLTEKELEPKGVSLEMIFVDDGSGDNSYKELLKIKEKRPSTTIIKLSRNFGAVHAVKTGFKFVTGDCFMVLSADLQDPPSLIPQMVDKWLEGEKFIICARRARKDPIFSKMTSWIYYRLIRFLVFKDYPYGGFDMSLMDNGMLEYLQKSAKNINLPVYIYSLGFKPCVIHYDRQERKHGKSMWTFSKKIKFFLDSILGFSILPIRIMSLVGLMVSFLSFCYGIMVVVGALIGSIQVPGFATITALITFLLGLILVMLGVIGEYLWRIFDEVNNRPESVIEEVK